MAAVLCTCGTASASWLWAPREQVTNAVLPDSGAFAEHMIPGRSGGVIMQGIVRVWDGGANLQGRGYFVRLLEDGTWASAWDDREPTTYRVPHEFGTKPGATDHHLVEDRYGAVHMVSEIHFPVDARNAAIGYRRRGGAHWDSTTLSIYANAPDSGCTSPRLFLEERGPHDDLLHLCFRRPTSQTTGYMKYTQAVADSGVDAVWDAESFVTNRIGTGDLYADGNGYVHFFGSRSTGGTTTIWHLRGQYPGAGLSWSTTDTPLASYSTAAMEAASEEEGGIIAAADTGSLYYAYVAPSGGAAEIFLRKLSLANYSWSAPTQITSSDGQPSRGAVLRITEGASPVFHLLYVEPALGPDLSDEPTATDTVRVYHTFCKGDPLDAGNWSSPTEVDREHRTCARRPQIVARSDTSGSDTAWVTYVSHDDDHSSPPDDDYEMWARKGWRISDEDAGQSETWSGLVYLDEDYVVEAGKTLTITAGTRVLARASGTSEKVGLVVAGQITAVGTPSEPILFASYGGTGDPGEWDGIVFASTADGSASGIRYADVRAATSAISIDCALAPGIDHVTFSDNEEADIQLLRDVRIASGTNWGLGAATRVMAAPTSSGDDALGVSGLCDLVVQGGLVAAGEVGSPVTFSTLGTGQEWGGLVADLVAAPAAYGYTCSSALHYSEVSNASAGIRVLNSGAPGLEHVAFENITGDRDIVLEGSDVYVPYDVGWTLEAGTRVKVQPHAAGKAEIGGMNAGLIDVVAHGPLVTLGTAQDSVFFEPEGADPDSLASGLAWGGIWVDWMSTGGSIEYADIGYARIPLTLFLQDSSLRHSRLHHFRDEGLRVAGSVALNGGPEIIGNLVERGEGLALAAGNTGIDLLQVSAATVSGNTVDLSGDLQGAEGGVGLRWTGGHTYCGAVQSSSTALVIQSNVLVGPGGDHEASGAKWNGICGNWLCGASNRDVDIVGNTTTGWNGAGMTFVQAKDVQVTCNAITSCFMGVDFSRNTDVTGPGVRFRANVIEVGAYGPPTQADQDVVVTDNAAKLALGPMSGAGDRGGNHLKAAGADWLVQENDGSASNYLNARNNWWIRNGNSFATVDSLPQYFRKDAAVSDSIRVDPSDILDPGTQLELCGSAGASREASPPRSEVLEERDDAVASGESAELPDRTSLVVLGPFAGGVEVRFALADRERCEVTIDVFNIAGRRVRRLLGDALSGGRYGVTWDGVDGAGNRVGAGVYLIRMRAGTVTQVRKVALIR